MDFYFNIHNDCAIIHYGDEDRKTIVSYNDEGVIRYYYSDEDAIKDLLKRGYKMNY